MNTKLLNQNVFKELPPDKEDYSEECFQVSNLEETGSSTFVRGVELNPNGIPLYPLRSMSLEKNQHAVSLRRLLI